MKVYVIVRETEDHYTFTDVLGVAINEEKAKKKVQELRNTPDRWIGSAHYTYYEYDSNDLKNVTINTNC